jgi:predicted ATPase
MLRLAQSAQHPYLLSLAHEVLGFTLYYLGELTAARTHLEQGIALYDPQKHPRSTVNTADPRVDCLTFVSWPLWHLGYPEQALQRSQEAVALAAGLPRSFSLAQTLGFAAVFHLLRREEQIAREQAETVLTLATEQGFPFWMAYGRMLRGWALAEQGQVEDGIAQMQQGLAACRAMGTQLGPIRCLPWLAAAYAKVGQVEKGLTVLAEALAMVGKTGARFSEAELYRLRGEITLAQSSVQRLESSVQKEAEECFLKAIEVARNQQAKSLELRAVMSLARLWQSQGKHHAARNTLAEVYGWFTEGFDTKDLQEAKALLDELN